jgi:SanA protein
MIFKLIAWLITLGVVAFVGLFGYLLLKEYTLPRPGSYTAMILLGAQVETDKSGVIIPSPQLEWRLSKALDIYRQQALPIVVTGDQGDDEPATEASVMRAWLIQRGVIPNDVTMDETSMDTKQNIANAMRLLPPGTVDVMIVTSDYHLPRALQIARDLGINPSGAGSPIKPEFWWKNHLRETLAWGKYFLGKVIPMN